MIAFLAFELFSYAFLAAASAIGVVDAV